MNYIKLDEILKEDKGNRGLMENLPKNPVDSFLDNLKKAKRVLLLSGFPVKDEYGNITCETDGPSGIANIANSFKILNKEVKVITDKFSYDVIKAAVNFKNKDIDVILINSENPREHLEKIFKEFSPTHFISLERPGKAKDGHYYDMRGNIIDNMIVDTQYCLEIGKKNNVVTISIGDGGNEMGMGKFKSKIEKFVKNGKIIATNESADITLVSGVSNWWAYGVGALLSSAYKVDILPTDLEEKNLLKKVINSGGIDGVTKKPKLTVDGLSLEDNIEILRKIRKLVRECI